MHPGEHIRLDQCAEDTHPEDVDAVDASIPYLRNPLGHDAVELLLIDLVLREDAEPPEAYDVARLRDVQDGIETVQVLSVVSTLAAQDKLPVAKVRPSRCEICRGFHSLVHVTLSRIPVNTDLDLYAVNHLLVHEMIVRYILAVE